MGTGSERRGRGGRPRADAQAGASRGERPGGHPRADGPAGVARRERLARARGAVVVPPITYPPQLPVSARREEIAAAIRDHQVVVVSGETGSGKTTQLPKILLDLGRGRAGQIGHTQPRRIAARSVAERISEELTGGPGALGTLVGYQVRFTDTSSEQTLVKVMTDGILLAQIQNDPELRAYDTIVVDEAHERSLNIDFLLGYLTRLLPRRPDLKLVITSATIDSDRFARHFAGPPTPEHPDGVPAPVVEVTGRTYPVQVRYRPLTPDVEPGDPQPEPRDLMTAICEAVDELCLEGPGDILVFLSGEREIRDAEDALRGHLGPLVVGSGPLTPRSVELLPLYSRLSAAEQHRVFEQHPARRVVLSTNVAETSLTVPGVRYVVDPGTARISRWSKTTKVQRLPIETISQASAQQRAGRCGRVADGVAIRLYSQDDFESRPPFTEPEILRTSLASVILQMVAVGVAASPGDVTAFPFVEPPDTRAVRDGVALLVELGALSTGDGVTRLTDVGRALAQLPVDPRLARMVVEGGRRDVAREVMIIAAALSIQDPRERPAEQRELADQQHARFADPTSDLLGYLNLWHYVRDSQREMSGSAFRRMCRAEHLNYLRLREWQDVVTQLKEMAKPLGIVVRPPARLAAAQVAGGEVARGGSAGAESAGGGSAGAEVASSTPDRPSEVATRRRNGDPAGGGGGGGGAGGGGEGAGAGVGRGGEAERGLVLAWDADRIHQSVLAGVLSHIGMQEATDVRVGAKARPDERRGGRARGRNEYLGARGARFAIFPGSALARRPPAWVMAGELVETSRLWARDVARIQPEWAEELAPHLVKRTYAEPRWSSRQGAAVVLERVLLYGVPIVAGRQVLLGKVDPEHARELFIRHALVQGEWTTRHAFFHANRDLLAQAEQVEHRVRRRGLVVDDDALAAFYDQRLPAGIVSARHFDTWWKTERRRSPDLLTFTLDQLLADDAAPAVDEALFPTTWPQGELSLPITYTYDPGSATDGVSVHVPAAVLARVVPDGFDWLVPGLWPELAAATVRSLPKPVRVQLVPAPDVARDVVAWIARTQPAWADIVRAGDMAPSWRAVFADAVRDLRGVEVPQDAWAAARLPDHLTVTFRVLDERRGSTMLLDEGPDLPALQRRLAAHAEAAVRTAVRDALRDATGARPDRGVERSDRGVERSDRGVERSDRGVERSDPGVERSDRMWSEPGRHTGRVGLERSTTGSGSGVGGSGVGGSGSGSGVGGGGLERSGLTTWPTGLPDGALPTEIRTTSAGHAVIGYPTLVVERPRADGAAPVALRVLAAPDRHRHDEAVRELLLGELGLATARVTSRWSSALSLAMAGSRYPSTAALVTELQRTALDALLAEHAPASVRDDATYLAVRTALRDVLEDRTHALAADVAAVLGAARELDAAVRSTTSLALVGAVSDVRGQLDALTSPGFVVRTGAARLPRLTCYLRAARHRLAKAAENPHRDAALAAQVREVATALATARTAAAQAPPDPARDARLTEAGWLIEELRVSLFAQQLGTPVPVSVKRIRALLA